MPRARYTAEGGTYRVAGISFEPGDEQEVDHELAAYLGDHDDFEVSVEKAAAGSEAAEERDDAEGDGEDSSTETGEADVDDEFDAAAFVGRTPYDDVVEDIEAGDVDDHLDAVAEAASRVGVEDAIGQRRAELEG